MNVVVKNPIEYFEKWFEAAVAHPTIKEANAVNLVTATRDGTPSNRMVLLKDFHNNGFVFYTHSTSIKGLQLEENPQAALCFYWEPLGRQIRVEGRIETVCAEAADKYFASRPLKSRIGAWASKQSQPLASRASLLKEVVRQTAGFATEEISRPPSWLGYRLVPSRMEFWQRGEYRLHDRLLYETDDSGAWTTKLLYP